MKKSELQLFKVASRILAKYAAQTLQEIIGNAAGGGEGSENGIMNFPAQLKKDQADLRISVTISNGMLGGSNVVVDPPMVDPPEVAANYARLPEQIKRYLDRNLSGFPQIPTGTTRLQYTGKDADPGIARN